MNIACPPRSPSPEVDISNETYDILNDADIDIIREIRHLTNSTFSKAETHINAELVENCIHIYYLGIARLLARMMPNCSFKTLKDILLTLHLVQLASQTPQSIITVSVIYLSRLLRVKNVLIQEHNWRYLFYSSLILAIKIEDDYVIDNQYASQLWNVSFNKKEHMDINNLNNFILGLVVDKQFRIHVPIKLYEEFDNLIDTLSMTP